MAKVFLIDLSGQKCKAAIVFKAKRYRKMLKLDLALFVIAVNEVI